MALKYGEKLADLRRIDRRQGRLEWIGIRPAVRADMIQLEKAELISGQGLQGDHRARRAGSKRQISIIQLEHLHVIARLLDRDTVLPELLRRNLVISNINISTLRNERFSIGKTILEGSGYCHPCSRMEENLGPGGYNASRGHGGITACILEGGSIELGEGVKRLVE